MSLSLFCVCIFIVFQISEIGIKPKVGPLFQETFENLTTLLFASSYMLPVVCWTVCADIILVCACVHVSYLI